jgi:hypothetical protein
MTPEDEEFNRVEREASLRKAAVQADVTKREWVELTRGDIISMEIPADASIVDIAWAIEAIIKKKNT